MIPVVSDYACSGVAVWVNSTEDGHLYQIRNLELTTNAGLQDNPVIVVYLPDEGHAHVLPTFSGYIGAHAGMNAHGIALSEKGASPNRVSITAHLTPPGRDSGHRNERRSLS